MKNKLVAAGVLVLLAPLIVGCAENNGEASAARLGATGAETVTVKQASLAPVVSQKSTVAQAGAFVVSSLTRGAFVPAVKVGDKVAAGKVLGHSSGAEIITPVPVVITSVLPKNDDVPKNYPLFEMTYQGFAIEADAARITSGVSLADVTGKFQILEGQGPNNCTAVMAGIGTGDSAKTQSNDAPQFQDDPPTSGAGFIAPVGFGPESDAEPDTPQDPGLSSGGETGQPKNKLDTGVSAEPSPQAPRASTGKLVCLIDKGLEVHSGLQATVVFSGVAKQNALVLPLNAVAGRAQNGRVLKKEGDAVVETEVQLGVSDGARIEIVSGLKEGDEVLLTPPDLDPRAG
ncbi:hypothetical protein KJY77_06120 [Canibacter sp. lx-72]|uniref:hypothetical protein n=1 Tax=Canibacter zhuwentaonis TaxID=2837491 RepID=UPI001BDCC371|nr:hypothetical protein [Canibacter zhuwentaonis]MBT1018704.1 hypothetical protein [Canibacter zhuwentaonis]MBT1035875.1 hypothetical protein [Canibacter zhuwentaonis]